MAVLYAYFVSDLTHVESSVFSTAVAVSLGWKLSPPLYPAFHCPGVKCTDEMSRGVTHEAVEKLFTKLSNVVYRACTAPVSAAFDDGIGDTRITRIPDRFA